MNTQTEKAPVTPGVSIWWFAFGYFAAYVPYSALTKFLTGTKGVPGAELLPITGLASLIGMFVFMTAMRWWKYAKHIKVGNRSLPFPRKWTFLSGLCTATIIATTTLAYTFEGISIVFMMLLLRGGVLIIAPMVDAITGRKVRWFSFSALVLSLAALLVAFFGRWNPESGIAFSAIAAIDVLIYLSAYFFRLQFMSRLAKSENEDDRKTFFVEEQMTATPMLMVTLGLFGIIGIWTGPESFFGQVGLGFTNFFVYGAGIVVVALLIGVLSQFTGIFGSLVLLDKRENTYCVPVNRASSILSGLFASVSLMIFNSASAPPGSELIGAFFILAAIGFLSIPPIIEKERAKRAAAAAPAEPEVAAPAAGEAKAG
ncbi:MAG: hypothetical protein ACOCVR_00915 [Myxococcota bacterium]